VRIDRSDSADGPEDAHVARSARSAPDDPDAVGKDGGTAVSGDGPSHSPSASSDTTLRTERFAAHRAKVDAVYRQHAIDHGHARVEKLERETITPGTRHIEAEDAKPHPVGLIDRSKGRDRLAEPDHVTKDETRQVLADTTAADSGMRDPTISGDRSREYGLVPRTPVAVHDCDLPEGYKSSPALKGDPYHPDAVSERSMAFLHPAGSDSAGMKVTPSRRGRLRLPLAKRNGVPRIAQFSQNREVQARWTCPYASDSQYVVTHPSRCGFLCRSRFAASLVSKITALGND
jgi:hypothetical protein